MHPSSSPASAGGGMVAADIAFIGGGPASLVAAIALARRGVASTVFERDTHPERAPRFNPDRSYTIDISGHGLKALRHIDACDAFDERLIRFKGLKLGRINDEWTLPGWTGSRGDILRALMSVATQRHLDRIRFEFESRVQSVDVEAGTLTVTAPDGATTTRRFDLLVGGDGAGSGVRKAMQAQVEGMTVESKSLPNYCTMIELDRVGDRLDRHYLHGLSLQPFSVAGAIRGDDGPESSRWFCAVGTRAKQEFASADEARQFFRARVPRVLDYASDESIAAFAGRTCYHIGQKLTCSRLSGGRAVLIGDAAGPFPPIGQGVNAAMASTVVLDECLAGAGHSPEQALEGARRYDARWKPESDAISWISEKSLFENRYHFVRSILTTLLHVSIFDEAKSVEVPWSEVRRKAQRRWPLWA